MKNLQLLFIGNALIWIYLGALWLSRLDNYSGREHIVYFNSAAMAANAFIMLVIAYFVAKRNKFVYWFSVIYLLVNIFLTIADQFGFYDFLILAIETAVLYYLIKNRLYYLPQ